MGTYYIDHVNGDDGSDGLAWATAWKTITGGATAARTAPGDVIKIAKTPDPTSIGNATWTDLSNTVTLAAANTAIIDLCATAWTPASNVTCITTTTRKEGSAAVSITVGTSFTTGKIAYKTIASTDFSAYQQISFWIQSTVALTALQICLCSDTAGATPVDTFTIPAISVVSRFHPVTINKGSALGSAIKSVALYAIVDPGTPTIIIDDIIACKAVGDAGSLSLQSIISKNSAAYGGTDSWHGIQSINNTTIMLDQDTTCLADAGRGYSGTTETVTTYKRETVKLAAAETINETGAEGAVYDYEFGYNTSTDIQDGETWLDGWNGSFYCVSMGTRSFIKLNRVSAVRGTVGIYITGGCYFCEITFGSSCNNATLGVQITSAGSANIINGRDACNNQTVGVSILGAGHIVNITNVNSNRTVGFQYSTALGCRHNITNLKNNGTYGLQYTTSNNTRGTVNTANNATAAVAMDAGLHHLNKSTLTETTEVTGLTAYGEGRLYSTLHDNTPLSHKIFLDGGTIQGQSAVRYTSSGIAWKISPTSTNRNSFYPITMPIARVAVDSGSSVTVAAWFLRDSIDITGRMVIQGGQLSGITTTLTDTITAGINTWEELTLTFTPTESGVVEIEAWAYGGTTNSVYVDSFRAA